MEYLLEGSWDYAVVFRLAHTAEHGISLPRSSLSICKNGRISAHEKVINMPGRNPTKQFLLRGGAPKNIIEAKAALAIIDHGTIILDTSVTRFPRLA